MHRAPLLALLRSYAAAWPEEAARASRFEAFVRAHPDCLLRSCRPGHVTGSAWIVSPDGAHVLLTHHRKLDRWLQLGGHADGEADVVAAALREAREESGLADLVVRGPNDGSFAPLDLDVHEIPARGEEPRHLHYDVRFLVVAARDRALVVSDESHALRWVDRHELAALAPEESLLRMARKAEAWLAEGRS
ncbi:MAG TPA: NUDIX hydrolase [Myxococcota bacterium]|nr:NUDIX hydrolase [Myxococcota bacterium]